MTVPWEVLRDLPLREYAPTPALRRDLSTLSTPGPPIIDAHCHPGRWLTTGWGAPDVERLLELMDRVGIVSIVNLDGMWGEELRTNLDRFDRAVPGRFVTFARLDPGLVTSGAWSDLARQTRDAFAAGARGLKVWKDLGLQLHDERGTLVLPDDRRLDPIWEACAEAGVPVTIHTADPIAFFHPLDASNERLEELIANPSWWVGDRERFPSFDALRDSLETLVASHPDVTFIGAHVLCSAEDLAWVGRMMDAYPNVHADLAARIAELGRAPRAARDLFVRHPDRFLFGTDEIPIEEGPYAIHRRFLETSDEAFAYSADPIPPQGRWTISGLDLPTEVAGKIYAENARRTIPGLA